MIFWLIRRRQYFSHNPIFFHSAPIHNSSLRCGIDCFPWNTTLSGQYFTHLCRITQCHTSILDWTWRQAYFCVFSFHHPLEKHSQWCDDVIKAGCESDKTTIHHLARGGSTQVSVHTSSKCCPGILKKTITHIVKPKTVTRRAVGEGRPPPYLEMLTKVENNLWICPVVQICSKM